MRARSGLPEWQDCHLSRVGCHFGRLPYSLARASETPARHRRAGSWWACARLAPVRAGSGSWCGVLSCACSRVRGGGVRAGRVPRVRSSIAPASRGASGKRRKSRTRERARRAPAREQEHEQRDGRGLVGRAPRSCAPAREHAPRSMRPHGSGEQERAHAPHGGGIHAPAWGAPRERAGARRARRGAHVGRARERAARASTRARHHEQRPPTRERGRAWNASEPAARGAGRARVSWCPC